MHNITLEVFLPWAGCWLGIVGATLVALNIKISSWGFVFFLFSNVAWIAFALLTSVHSLSTQHFYFSLTSLLGIYRWRKSIDIRQVPLITSLLKNNF